MLLVDTDVFNGIRCGPVWPEACRFSLGLIPETNNTVPASEARRKRGGGLLGAQVCGGSVFRNKRNILLPFVENNETVGNERYHPLLNAM